MNALPELKNFPVPLSTSTSGVLQRSGPMSVLPLLGRDAEHPIAPPLTGMKLSAVKGYGNLELENPGRLGPAIVPLHIGYIQTGAQNHAACRSAFIGEGQKFMFQDACCVQAGQGGYLEGREQWFFILPLQLREEALKLRGVVGYSKLWAPIAKLNERLGLPSKGHLEHLVCNQRPYLTQFQSRFERLPGQTGMVVFLNDRLAGIEISPGASYFEEIWMPLICFSYGSAAFELEKVKARRGPAESPRSVKCQDLEDVRMQLAGRRRNAEETVRSALERATDERFESSEEENFLDLTLSTVTSKNFAGQIVQRKSSLVYASIAARPAYVMA